MMSDVLSQRYALTAGLLRLGPVQTQPADIWQQPSPLGVESVSFACQSTSMRDILVM